MPYRYIFVIVAAFFQIQAVDALAAEAGDPAKGEQLFRACAACHSLTPKRHMTGPSLADIWQRKAGTVEDFSRYSDALKEAELVWDADTLDAWLADPRARVPGNRMNFRGIKEADKRQDLIAYLRQAAAEGRPAQDAERGDDAMDLKAAPPANRVASVGYCGDTYKVKTESGEELEFWEFNLRIKTDSSDKGPAPERPVLISGGMMGDRAFLVFAAPAEISSFISPEC